MANRQIGWSQESNLLWEVSSLINRLTQVTSTNSGVGLIALNGLTNQVQYLATGTSGTDFTISSVSNTHTFNLPTASAANRGALSSTDWTTFNAKVPSTRNLTINGTAFDLSADRTWVIDALPSQTGNNGYYLQTNGAIASWQPLVIDNTASKLFYFYNFT